MGRKESNQTKPNTNIHKAKCMYIHVCLSATCVHAWIQELLPGWWAVRAQLVEKSPDYFLVQLILQWGPNVYFKEAIIFPESRQGGGSKMSGGPTFSKVMGPSCFFLLNLLFSRGFRTPCTPSGFAHCLCARVYVCGLLKSQKKRSTQ